uniref:Amino acid/amide ABC transporter ATP-binding protein 2, HAAT family n=1 Tax=Candidatus Kentrum sp. DK TaxID=2126562 RepID=A0A450SU21_9GAMM|nr:MAG: amino acid/amide ABC transporter ATP-binding protein 2, HAAT family [Candidatus Kentron sp. DK]VFJ57445.1 MAG: amino acid/amide ABC transporter ATP-binding protein 2, HAAT family [Candidatus Kentron sp. DK]
MPFLEVKNLTAFYGTTEVLHGLDFALEEGDIATILGANGAGKTTTLRALCGMVRAGGEIVFAGRRITNAKTEAIARAGLAHVPQGRGTFTRLSTEENLRLGAYARKDREGIRRDIAHVYDYFPRLAERANQQAGALSGGEQQMLAISRALLSRPRLMLLDEPSFGLAPLVVRDLFAILARINREERITMLLVEQNATLALALASHAWLLETGRVVMSGSAGEIAANEAVRESYLGY